VAASGLDPNNLPDGDKATMNFRAGESSKAKAWKDVWGAGQGVGGVTGRMGAGEFIARLRREYEEARARLLTETVAFTS
jgi:nitronate monooxygenase